MFASLTHPRRARQTRVSARLGAAALAVVCAALAVVAAPAQAAAPVHAYVSNYVSDTLSVIDPATNSVVATVPGGPGYPEGVAFTPDGTRVYVADSYGSTVSVIETTTNAVVATVPVGLRPQYLAITPDGTRAYVANSGTDPDAYSSIMFSNTVSVIDTNPASPTYDTVVDTVTVGDGPLDVAITPDGTRAYVTDFAPALDSSGNTVFGNTVSVIDTNPASPTYDTVVGTVTVGNAPYGVAIALDGRRAYVANFGDGTVSVIDTSANAVVATIGPINGQSYSDPRMLAVTPDAGSTWVATAWFP